MKKHKRIMHTLLALCLSLSVFSLTAFAATQFTDVKSNQWYYKYVTGIVDKGIMTGTSQNTFSPNSLVTRAQVAQTLYALAGKPASSYKAQFSDLKKDAYYIDAINWGTEKGILAGYGSDFKPNQPITREQFSTVLFSYARKVDTYDRETDKRGTITYYKDANQVASYASTAIQWAVGINVITSTSITSMQLSPKGEMTRAQLATMLLAYINHYALKPSPETHTDSNTGTDYVIYTVSTPYFKVTVPTYEKDSVICYTGNDEIPYLSFVEPKSNRSGYGGHVFTIMLFPPGRDYDYLPEYEVIGKLSNGKKSYTVIIDYPTDVQFALEYEEEYHSLAVWRDVIVKDVIEGINGYTLEKY